MGTQLNDPINITERLKPIGDMVNRRRFRKALAMSRRLNEDVLDQPGRHRNVNVAYWQQRAMINLKLKRLDEALVSIAKALEYSNHDPEIRSAFGRDLAIYLIKSGTQTVPYKIRFLTGQTSSVQEAVDHLLAPMADGDVDHRALQVSITGRFWLWQAVRAEDDTRFDQALKCFQNADKLWENTNGEYDEQWCLNNRVYLYMTLRLIRHITPDELRRRDEVYRFILENDPSLKRRVMIWISNKHRDLAFWTVRHAV